MKCINKKNMNLNNEYGQDVSRETIATVEKIAKFLTNPILFCLNGRVKLANETEQEEQGFKPKVWDADLYPIF